MTTCLWRDPVAAHPSSPVTRTGLDPKHVVSRSQSLAGKTKHQLWLELCDIITKHPAEITTLPVDAILRGGVRKFTDEVGRLWTSLADFYIRRGLFEKARDVYEEVMCPDPSSPRPAPVPTSGLRSCPRQGVNTVVTVRDFSMIFDAYTQFEESMIAAKMEAAGDAEDGPPPPPEEFLMKDDGNDLELRLARLQALIERRPELLSSVMLRQNPHNVLEWLKRVALFEGNPNRQILTYTEAVKTVLPEKAVGRPPLLWVAFARFYEDHGDVANARVIFEKATAVPYHTVDDLALVWCEWAEMELRHKQFNAALGLMRRATVVPDRLPPGTKLEDAPVQARLHKNLKIWSFYSDLEESLGTLESTRAVYDAMLDLRVATAQTVLNYSALLADSKHWEDAFAVYERGVNAFRWPQSRDIWMAYLQEFLQRYGGRKLERARDLFEQALSVFPPDAVKDVYLAFAKLEEEHGLARHAMDIYARAVRAVPGEEKLAVVELYVAKALDFFGVGKVRSIYEEGIEADPPLPDALVKTMCLKYAGLERKLGEIDRARGLFVHGSQFANPAVDSAYWEEWNAFEVRHGNEDTFREMLRIKRSVTAAFSNMHFNMAVIELPSAVAGLEAGDGNAPSRGALDPMAGLEAAAAAPTGNGLSAGLSKFVSAGVTGTPSLHMQLASAHCRSRHLTTHHAQEARSVARLLLQMRRRSTSMTMMGRETGRRARRLSRRYRLGPSIHPRVILAVCDLCASNLILCLSVGRGCGDAGCARGAFWRGEQAQGWSGARGP